MGNNTFRRVSTEAEEIASDANARRAACTDAVVNTAHVIYTNGDPNELRTAYGDVEAYMRSCMNDSAHDVDHIYRVLNYALDIAGHEEGADVDLLVVACLLHDIGRAEQLADPAVDHARAGADKACAWLIEKGYSDEFAQKAGDCVRTHRYRSGSPPVSLEAKILFDADKLEACGVIGIARTLQYKAHTAEPLYAMTGSGQVSDGSGDGEQSFLREYKFKLENVYDKFYTRRGYELAAKRKQAAVHFYNAILSELRECYGLNKNVPNSEEPDISQ